MEVTKVFNIYEQQKRNIRLTILIMFVFVLFFALLGYGFDYFYFGNDPLGLIQDRVGFPISTFFALTLGSLIAGYGFQNGSKVILRSTGAYLVPDNEPKYQTLRNVVEEMKIASGLSAPKVYIIPDTDPNAFATGRNPENSHIAVTEGLIEKLNREELQGVIAHEMSHIKNYDTRLMTVVAALIGAIALLSDFAVRGIRFGRGKNVGKRPSRVNSKGNPFVAVLFVIWILGIVMAPIVSRLLAMAVSRRREYLADASAAELTRNPLALATALEKIEKATQPTKSIKKGSAHLCIIDPLGLSVNEREGRIADLFATHPPIKNRILYLKNMAYSFTK